MDISRWLPMPILSVQKPPSGGCHPMSYRPSARRFWRPLILTLAGLGVAVLPTAALAATTGTRTTNAVLSAGKLSINSVGAAINISGKVAATLTGLLPAVTAAGSTNGGWNVTLGVSNLTFNGTWVAQGSALALTTATSNAFTDTVDGVAYIVTTGTITAGAGSFTYTSTDSADASGSGTAVASINNAVGTKGLTINFGTQAITSGSKYQIKVGTESASAISLNTSASGAGVITVSGNTAPTLLSNGTTVSGGGVASTSYGTAVKIASAAPLHGVGTYVITPGVNAATDAQSWAATYSAGLQYTIVTGP